MDFTGGAEIYKGLDEKLAGLDIGILGEFVYLCSLHGSLIFVLGLSDVGGGRPSAGNDSVHILTKCV